MANQEHLAILNQGADKWNEWRREHTDVQPDLSLANLRKTLLNYADLHSADLSGADLREADLNEADLSRANLNMANLKKTELIRADLRFASLDSADLTGATLYKADLREADLQKAELYGADLGAAILNKAILSEAQLMGACLRNANLTRADLSGADLTKADLSGADLTEVKLNQQPLLRGTYMFAAQRDELLKSGAIGLEDIELVSTDTFPSTSNINVSLTDENDRSIETSESNFTIMQGETDSNRIPESSYTLGANGRNILMKPSVLVDPSVTGIALLELARIGEEEFAE